MVGDSWAADVAGRAPRASVAIWFNPPAGLRRSRAGVVELRTLEPAEAVVKVIWQPTEASVPAA